MSDPFFDPAMIVSALAADLPAGLVAVVHEVGGTDQIRERRARTASPAILIVPQATDASGPDGLGNGRFIAELIGVVVQIRQAAPDGGQTARGDIRAIRSAIYECLEGRRLSLDWSPLLYQGGHLLDLDDDPDQIYRWIDFYRADTPTTLR
jgi:hypothetical protein